jgi:fatty acid-binding protein DegV
MSGKFPFAIIIDGTTVLPHEMRRELDMRTLPLHVSFGAESYTADVDLTSAQFYEKVKDPKAKPTTSRRRRTCSRSSTRSISSAARAGSPVRPRRSARCSR